MEDRRAGQKWPGHTFMDYTDEGEYYTGGRFGFRQVYDSEGTYDNLQLHDLSAE